MKIEQLQKNFKQILKIICDLSDREIIIIRMRFSQRKTQKEAAKMLNLTNERIRQIETKILKKIKNNK